ncbi:hypothetical protein FB451DRAFT_1570758 [Mycena latifolia]|nr:hypothetical protein FB451DRAFT_1570758 [Mycena latifolia]
MLLLKLSICFLSLVARSTLTAALNITIASQVEAPGLIFVALVTNSTDPDSLITHLFNVSNSVNTSLPSHAIGNAGARSQSDLNRTFTFNLPWLPEGGGWVITVQLLTQPGGGGTQLGPIFATSNTFSVIRAPQPESPKAATASSRTSFSAAAIELTIGGVVIIAAIAGWLIIRARRGSRKRSLSSAEDGRSRGPEPRASAASLDSLPEKAAWNGVAADRTAQIWGIGFTGAGSLTIVLIISVHLRLLSPSTAFFIMPVIILVMYLVLPSIVLIPSLKMFLVSVFILLGFVIVIWEA